MVVMEYDKGKISARGREISTPVTWDTKVRWDIRPVIYLRERSVLERSRGNTEGEAHGTSSTEQEH